MDDTQFPFISRKLEHYYAFNPPNSPDPEVKCVYRLRSGKMTLYGRDAKRFLTHDFHDLMCKSPHLSTCTRLFQYMCSVMILKDIETDEVKMLKNRFGYPSITQKEFAKAWSRPVLEMNMAIECGEKPISFYVSEYHRAAQEGCSPDVCLDAALVREF